MLSLVLLAVGRSHPQGRTWHWHNHSCQHRRLKLPVIKHDCNLVNRFIDITLSRLNPWYEGRERAARLNIEADDSAEVVSAVAW